MNKTKIEWVDYTWNPISGCKGGCFYCYGRTFRERFNFNKKWEELLENKKEWEAPRKLKKPSRIFIGSMTDMWAGWMSYYYQRKAIEIMKQCPQHTFYLLTKKPSAYSSLSFPDNCWLGITVTQQHEATKCGGLVGWKKTFVSIEPMLEKIDSSWLYVTKWIIIGAMSGRYADKYQPRQGWIKEILRQADKLNIPVFMKNNLKNVWKGKLRQEFPSK